MNDKGGTGEQTTRSILVYIRLEITLGATRQAEAAVFREMSPVAGRLLGQQLRSAGTFVWLRRGETQLTRHLNSWRARPPSAAVGGALCRKYTKKREPSGIQVTCACVYSSPAGPATTNHPLIWKIVEVQQWASVLWLFCCCYSKIKYQDVYSITVFEPILKFHTSRKVHLQLGEDTITQ